jgi:hypothetical protein
MRKPDEHHDETKSERRERRRKNKRKMRVDAAGLRQTQRLIERKAKQARES